MEVSLIGGLDKALFFCSLCDDSDTEDPNVKSDQFDSVAEHVRCHHNVTEQEGINFSIKIPRPEYLRKYKCMLCQKQFVSTTEERLIKGHFKSVHNTKNVKPRQIKRICRICSWDKSTTDAELMKHISESHPPDSFADEDEEDEAAKAAKELKPEEEDEEEEELDLQIKPPQPQTAVEQSKKKLLKLEDGECTPETSARKEVVSSPVVKASAQQLAMAAVTAAAAAAASNKSNSSPLAAINGITNSNSGLVSSRKRKSQSKTVTKSSDSSSEEMEEEEVEEDSSESSIDSSSSSSSTSSEDEKAKKQRRKMKRKKAKKHKHKKKHHKRKKRSNTTVIMKYQSDDNATEDDEDEDEEEEPKASDAKQKQLVSQIINVDSLEDEEDEAEGRKIVVKPLKLVPEASGKTATGVQGDISLFHKLRGHRNESSEEGELRDSPTVADKRKARIMEQTKSSISKSPVIRMKSLALETKDCTSNNTWKEEEDKYDEGGRERKSSSAGQLKRSSSNSRSVNSSSKPVVTHGGSRPSLDDFFCDECKLPVREDEAYDHYSGSLHRYNTKSKIRCYLCNRYTENTKDHLERNHFRDIFQCKLQCSNPKFLDLVKILNHMEDKHSNMIRGKSNDELFRRNMISMPQSLASYRCKICNRQFVGQTEEAVLLHQKREDGIRNSTFRDILYFCRICGGKKSFEDDRDLKAHIKSHLDYKNKAATRSRSRTPRSRSPRESSRRKYHRDSSDSSSRRSRDRRSRERRHHSRSSSSSKSRSRSPLTKPPPSVVARKRRYVRCVYCPQVTEPLEEDIKSHQMTHRDVFFKCQQCRERFQAANVKDIFEHLVNFHKKRDDDPEYLLKHYTIIPSDLRRIYCVTCYKDASDTSKVPEWCCQTLAELKSTLIEHMEEKHGRKQTFGETFRLGCRACKEYFDAEFEEDQWRNHVRKGHEYKTTSSSSAIDTRRSSYASSHRRSSRASSSSSSSNSSSDSSSSDSDADHRRKKGRHKSDRSSRDHPEESAKPKLTCNYCYESVGETETMLGIHIRDKHSEFIFRCMICPGDTKEFFHDEPSTYNHMVKEHKSDAKFKSWRSHVSSPKDLRCIKCQLCASAYFYGEGGVDIEAFKRGHFAVKHADSSFHQGHLDFLCRICMRPGENDDEDELKDHLKEQHPEIKKEKQQTEQPPLAKSAPSPISEYGTPIKEIKKECPDEGDDCDKPPPGESEESNGGKMEGKDLEDKKDDHENGKDSHSQQKDHAGGVILPKISESNKETSSPPSTQVSTSIEFLETESIPKFYFSQLLHLKLSKELLQQLVPLNLFTIYYCGWHPTNLSISTYLYSYNYLYYIISMALACAHLYSCSILSFGGAQHPGLYLVQTGCCLLLYWIHPHPPSKLGKKDSMIFHLTHVYCRWNYFCNMKKCLLTKLTVT